MLHVSKALVVQAEEGSITICLNSKKRMLEKVLRTIYGVFTYKNIPRNRGLAGEVRYYHGLKPFSKETKSQHDD